MGKGCLVLAFFVVGAVLGYVLAFGFYILVSELTGFHDFEGAWAMGMAFQIGPVVALVCGGAAAWWIATRPGGGP